MTAVLSPSDALRKESIMASLDDHQLDFSSSQADWKSKYYEVADMLAETRHELDEFQQSSKELEEELERDLQRTEKAQQDLRLKVERAENEREEWKAKFVSLQTTHNMSTARLQRELDTLRQDHQKLKVQLRELEMGNDDLERNERAVTSSLADVEAKYSLALEEKILLEHELLDKANLEEECQRLKDDLRDTNAEVSVLRDQLETALARSASNNPTFESFASDTSPSDIPSLRQSLDDDLLRTGPPSDLQLSDLSLEAEMPSTSSATTTATTTDTPRPSTSSLSSDAGQSALLQRAGFSTSRSSKLPSPSTPTTPTSSLNRSTTLPSFSASPSRLPAPRATPRATPRVPSTPMYSASSTSNIPGTTRSKGVQMVSEMRAKVKNLEQKIHTRVPRMRMGSTSTRPSGSPPVLSTSSKPSNSSSTLSFRTSTRKSLEEKPRLTSLSQSTDSPSHRKRTPTKSGDGGWVLILEDSPSPLKGKDRSSKSPPRDGSPTPSSADSKDSLSRSSIGSTRRPGSPLSTSTEGRTSVSTTATTATSSSIATPSSRPTTPTFLPVRASSKYSSKSALSRSMGPSGSGPYSSPYSPKRSSLGSNRNVSPPDSNFLSDSGIPGPRGRPTSVPVPPRGSNSPSSFKDPNLFKTPPLGHSNITVRGSSSRIPSSSSTSTGLGQSRIGRPNFAAAGRKSSGGDSDAETSTSTLKSRLRSGTLAASRRG